MKQQDFIAGLQEELELDDELTPETNLKELESWDSMAAMIVIGYVSGNFDMTLTADDLKNITTVSSLIDRIGASKFE